MFNDREFKTRYVDVADASSALVELSVVSAPDSGKLVAKTWP